MYFYRLYSTSILTALQEGFTPKQRFSENR
jgi:hypothetical protein